MKSKYQCIANIRGGPIRPQIKGIVFIKDVSGGAWVYANIQGLPSYQLQVMQEEDLLVE